MLKKAFLVIAVMLMSRGAARCCTVFTASVGDTVLFGNNEDWPDKDTRVWFRPATETDYGGVYFGFGDYYAQGGMNEHGLCFDATAIPELKMRPHPEKLRTTNFGKRVLEKCATIEEAVQFIGRYDLSGLDRAQFLFADKTGDSMIVCPGTEGEMKTIRKEEVYQVITNFNVTYPRRGRYPCWRYRTATEMLSEIEHEEDITVEYFTSVLKAVYQRSTAYSTIYDSTNGIIYLYSQHNFDEVVVFNLEDELEKGYHSYHIPFLFPEEIEPSKEPVESEPVESEPEMAENPDSQPVLIPSEPLTPPAPLANLFFAILIITLILVGMTLIWKKREKGDGKKQQ